MHHSSVRFLLQLLHALDRRHFADTYGLEKLPEAKVNKGFLI